jgi:hypothetical protein
MTKARGQMLDWLVGSLIVRLELFVAKKLEMQMTETQTQEIKPRFE